MIYSCCNNLRRTLLEKSEDLNGIDFVEVLPSENQQERRRHHILRIHFVNELSIGSLKRHNLRIDITQSSHNLAVDSISLPPFSADELSSSFAKKLAQREDPISDYLTGSFSDDARRRLAECLATNGDWGALQSLISEELNQASANDVIYDETRFEGVELREETLQLLQVYRQKADLAWVNRLLLEDAYPLQIARNKVLVVQLEGLADFSRHTLHLVGSSGDPINATPPNGFDPVSAIIQFSLQTETQSDFDCRPRWVGSPGPTEQPVFNYLAKDYSSFRALLLQRMRQLVPDWDERRACDLGITLIELLAYVGDYLSYQQDAVATEAYLGTARRRISVRRHARLVDYRMHDGCNARAWVAIEVMGDGEVQLKKGTQLLTRLEGEPAREDVVRPVLLHESDDYRKALDEAVVVFETMHEAKLFAAHNEMHFYTWRNGRCCLPKGATRATLVGDLENLQAGEVLIFEEWIDPDTGEMADSDMRRCHVVRLTKVLRAEDPMRHRSSEDDAGEPLKITEIEWAAQDALPFPFCISARTDRQHGEKYLENISVARGNIVLADHGRTIWDFTPQEVEGSAESLTFRKQKTIRGLERLRDGDHAQVPSITMFHAPGVCTDPCARVEPSPLMPRFRPALQERPLTWAVPFYAEAPATESMTFDPRDALPQIELESRWLSREATWTPRLDLLSSDPDAFEFVVEIESDGTAFLRFGDDKHGLCPASGTEFYANYRVGNGSRGNVGLEAIAHLVPLKEDFRKYPDLPKRIIKVRNPFPSRGGTEPETIEEARVQAPMRFREQERAVTEEDYGRMAQKCEPQVQQAVATFRWTGSWHSVVVSADRKGEYALDDEFKDSLLTNLDRYRMAGFDLGIEKPRYVPLDIEIDVHVAPDHFRGDVEEALLDLLSNRDLPNGRRGLFHPDNFSFGQAVYLGPLYAKALDVDGVDYLLVRKFERQDVSAPPTPMNFDKIEIGRLEIARLDNEPNFPENGILRLNMKGGK